MTIKRGYILHLIKRIQSLSKRRRLMFGLVSSMLLTGLIFAIWGVNVGFFNSWAAGPQVSNTATVSYQDLAGNTYSSQSNTVSSDLVVASTTGANSTSDTQATDPNNNSAGTSTGSSRVSSSNQPTSSGFFDLIKQNYFKAKETTEGFYESTGLRPWAFWFLFVFIPLLIIGATIFYFVKRKNKSSHLGVFLIFAILMTSLWPTNFLSPAKASSNLIYYYLSPSGSDTNAGTINAPFATLEKARETVKTAKNSMGVGFHGATVYLRGGEYNREDMFTLNAVDSGTAEAPIIYTAYLQEQPIIRGSRTITGWTPSVGNPNIYQADLTGQLTNDFVMNEVYFNGERQILARTPNYVAPDFTKSDPYEGTWNFTSLENDCAEVPIDNRVRKTTLIYNQADISAPTLDAITQSLALSPVNPAQMEIYSNTEYTKNIINLASVDSVNRQISSVSNASYDICAKNRYLLQNFALALDVANEWYQDRTNNLLYYMPKAPLTQNDRISVPFVSRAISLGSVQFTTFNGLTFEEFTGDVLVSNSANNISIFNNTFRSSRGQGIVLYAQSHDININWNLLYNLGKTGIYAENNGSGLIYVKNLNSSNIKINNNTIHDIGYFNCAYAITTYNTVGTVISHNEIYNLPRLAINVYSNDNIVEYNKVYNVNLLTKDSGGIYVGSRSWLRRGNIIRNNYVKDTNGYGKTPWGNGDGSYKLGNFTSGIYLDDYANGNFVYDNIVVNAQWGCFQNHLGRDNTYTNNICVEGGLETPAVRGQMNFGEDIMVDPSVDPYIVSMWDELQNLTANGYDRDKYFGRYPELANIVAPDSTRQGEIMVNNKVNTNIFYFPNGPNPLSYYALNLGSNQQIDNNIFWPGARTITASRPLSGDYSVNTWNTWKNLSFDVHSLVINPLFTNANVGVDGSMNFALAANSPALSLGFQPIDTTKIGHPGTSSDLLVTITQDLVAVRSGQTITYTLTVQNTSGVALTDVLLTDPISTKTKFISADNDGTFSANSATVSWPSFDLELDQTMMFTLKAQVL